MATVADTTQIPGHIITRKSRAFLIAPSAWPSSPKKATAYVISSNGHINAIMLGVHGLTHRGSYAEYCHHITVPTHYNMVGFLPNIP